MPAQRGSLFPRLLDIHLEVKANRYPNVPSLAESLGWCEKTIRRDVTYLRDSLGAPLAYDSHRRGFYYTRADYQFPSIAISEGELLGLFLGSQLLRQYHGTKLGEHLARLCTRLAEFLPSTVAIDLNDLPHSYAARPAPAEPIDATIMQTLLDSVRDCATLDVLYYTASRDLTQRRRIDPYGLYFVDGETYVVAYCHLREDIRKFHPARILELTRTPDTFTRPADFDLTSYLDDGFRHMRGTGPTQQVTLRFSPAIARFVQNRTWHPSQQTEPQPDGSLFISFRINHTLEVKRLALSFGPACEVLEPPDLRAEVESEIRAMLAVYERTSPNNEKEDPKCPIVP